MNTKNLSFKAMTLSLLMLSTDGMTFGAQDIKPTPKEVAEFGPSLSSLIAAYIEADKNHDKEFEKFRKENGENYYDFKMKNRDTYDKWAELNNKTQKAFDYVCSEVGLRGPSYISMIDIEKLDLYKFNILPLCKEN